MASFALKQQYRPYVPDFLSLCERNYAQLRFFLPQPSLVHASQSIQINALEAYCITVLAEAPFTTTVRIAHQSDSVHAWLKPQFEVRLYHDARLAEVVACQQIRRFKAVYSYPNTEMLQPDEKRQINALLRDWLTLCHKQGYSRIEVKP
jgi:uncharacterized protein YqiB (DUF1249 family)